MIHGLCPQKNDIVCDLEKPTSILKCRGVSSRFQVKTKREEYEKKFSGPEYIIKWIKKDKEG